MVQSPMTANSKPGVSPKGSGLVASIKNPMVKVAGANTLAVESSMVGGRNIALIQDTWNRDFAPDACPRPPRFSVKPAIVALARALLAGISEEILKGQEIQ